MKSFNLLLKAKTKDSLERFFKFLNLNINKNFIFITKNFQKNKKKSVLTILKSPHVNKTAQEQFEIDFLFKQVSISTTQLFKLLIFLKKIKNYLFADINFKIKFLTDNKKNKIQKKRLMNFDNFTNDFFFEEDVHITNKKSKTQRNQKPDNLKNKKLNSLTLLKIIDFYGLMFE